MTDVVRGSEIGVYVSGEDGNLMLLAYGTECELEKSREVVTCTLDSEGWQRVVAGKKSWRMTSSQLVGIWRMSADRLDELQESGKAATVVFGTAGAGGQPGGIIHRGSGLITELSYQAPNREAATISVSIDGDGGMDYEKTKIK